MAATAPGRASEVAPPSSRSPPQYPDFCGRRRLQLEVQILNREIGFLEEELQSLEEIHPVSRCCKELNEFVGAKPDPLIPINKRRHQSCWIWGWISSKLCFNFSWICCSSKCLAKAEKPSCTCPHPSNCSSCCSECRCPNFCCFPLSCCRTSCSCPEVSCCDPRCSCPCKPSCSVGSCSSCFGTKSNCKSCSSFCGCTPSCNSSCSSCFGTKSSCGICSSCCGGKPSCSTSCNSCACRPSCACVKPQSCCPKTACCTPPTSCRPEYSCGCAWSCRKCTDACQCPSFSGPCCISGCFC